MTGHTRTASDRVSRGGCWLSKPERCRSASRRRYDPGLRRSYLGFRLVIRQSRREA